MNPSAPESFACSACGTRFALSGEVAERKIACPCGNVFVAPALAPPVLPALPPQRPAPSAFDAYPRRRMTVAMDDSDAEFSASRDVVAPIVLLGLGLAMRVAEIPRDRSLAGMSVASAAAVAVFQSVLAAALMLAGVLIAARVLGTNFGLLRAAILKFCAIAIFAWACGALIVAASQYQLRGFVVAMNVMFLIYFAAFSMLFSLDVQEALLTTAICALIQDVAALALFFDGK